MGFGIGNVWPDWVTRLVQRFQKPEPPPKRPSREHNYTTQAWGHAIGVRLRTPVAGEHLWMGHGPANRDRMRDGDTLLIIHDAEGRTARWEVLKVEYFVDPRDMWKATVRFVEVVDPGETT